MYGLPAGSTRVLSSDLTAASDLLPLDLVEALVEGVLEGARWKNHKRAQLFSKLFRVLTGPQMVGWPGLKGEQSFAMTDNASSFGTKSKRGIMMGIPTTWFLLNLTHMFWISEAVRDLPRADLFQ